jgi:pimeloyl-ACP methyl ester carboxylesterase
VRDVINWRGQHRHFLDRAREVHDLPPVALFWGEADTLNPIQHAVDTASLMGGVTVTGFPGCGHFPHRQEPERFVAALEAFLDAPGHAGAHLHEGDPTAHAVNGRPG